MRKRLKKIKEYGLIADFRKFINKGNVVDMAVGIIIGGAFSRIVSSLVNDIVTPTISLLTGRVNLTEASVVLREARINDAGEVLQTELLLRYGQFLQYILDFLIISLSVFLFVRLIAKLREFEEKLEKEKEEKAEEEKKEEPPAPPPPPSKEELLLTEIRDILKQKT